MFPYALEVEETMRRFYNGLNERDQRLYSGVEALKLGHGGRAYIAGLLGCSRNTVSRGACEASGLSNQAVHEQLKDKKHSPRIRKTGGGRHSYEKKWGAELDEKFLIVVGDHTAGDPMDDEVRWTYLTPAQIAQELRDKHGFPVSKTVVRQLLKKHHYCRRKAQKKKTMKAEIENRDEQFKNIHRLTAAYKAAGNPIISMDTKKKEKLGNFYRDGHLYTTGELIVNDHDFNSAAEGVIIPHGLYDVQRNTGYLQIGNSHDTGEFACDSLRYWWYTYGCQHYPQASSLLILCDGGGSNSSRHYLFKQDLQALADEIGCEIRIAHYPPYCSKYNPIEHRLFPHVTRACQGVVFKSVEIVSQLMGRASTQQGLKTFTHLIDHVYETGRKVAEGFKETMRIVFDDYLPAWNYCARPMQYENARVI